MLGSLAYRELKAVRLKGKARDMDRRNYIYSYTYRNHKGDAEVGGRQQMLRDEENPGQPKKR